MHKQITVTSNAKNDANLKLSINFTFKPLVEVEPTSVRLSSQKGADTGAVVLIKTLKKDMQITGVSFKVSGSTDDFKDYIPIQYTMLPVQDTAKNGKAGTSAGKQESQAVYKLRITYTPCEKEDKYGEFVIQTNLPDKPEVKISGSLEAKKTL